MAYDEGVYQRLRAAGFTHQAAVALADSDSSLFEGTALKGVQFGDTDLVTPDDPISSWEGYWFGGSFYAEDVHDDIWTVEPWYEDTHPSWAKLSEDGQSIEFMRTGLFGFGYTVSWTTLTTVEDRPELEFMSASMALNQIAGTGRRTFLGQTYGASPTATEYPNQPMPFRAGDVFTITNTPYLNAPIPAAGLISGQYDWQFIPHLLEG